MSIDRRSRGRELTNGSKSGRLRAAALLNLLILLGFSLGTATDALAQRGRPVMAHSRRDLTFGNVLAGVPTRIGRLDPGSSGFYRIQGRPGAEVSIIFTLPPSLSSPDGTSMNVEFDAGDAGFAQDENQPASIGFDPHTTFTGRLGADGRAYVWLGGTVRPGPNQPAGDYDAGVVLTVSYTGN